MSKEGPNALIPPPRAVERPAPHAAQGTAAVRPVPSPPTLVPALLSSALLWLCFFPANEGWLGWVALVPLLTLVRSMASPRRLYLSAWVGGLLFFAVALQWLRVADSRMYATWIALTLYCSLYFPVAMFLLRRLDRRTRWPLVLTVPLVWTALELFRAHFLLGGFAWYFLGHSQHEFLPLIQISDLGGVYAVTFLVAAVNALIGEWLGSSRRFRNLLHLPAEACRSTPRQLWLQSAAVLGLIGAACGYGSWRLAQAGFASGPLVALIQGNLDQRIRNAASAPEDSGQAVRQVTRHFSQLCDEAVHGSPELIVWPENSFLWDWVEVAPELTDERIPDYLRDAHDHREKLAHSAVKRWPTNLLLGLTAESLGADLQLRRANSAVLIRADGSCAGRYDKMHCVPFGEYVPFRDRLPWLKKFAPYDWDYSVTPGEAMTRFPLGPYHFGVVICYEDTDPYMARQYVRPGSEPPVDFLLNISNDGWFDGTSEHDEHLAICRFRAIECRRCVARAVNMGISAVIDGNGRLVALPAKDWAGSKKVEAILTARVPIDRRASVYGQWGDWLPWGCWVLVGVGAVWPGRRPSARLR
jgi:apolipoprotein N-acyltransferase